MTGWQGNQYGVVNEPIAGGDNADAPRADIFGDGFFHSKLTRALPISMAVNFMPTRFSARSATNCCSFDWPPRTGLSGNRLVGIEARLGRHPCALIVAKLPRGGGKEAALLSKKILRAWVIAASSRSAAERAKYFKGRSAFAKNATARQPSLFYTCNPSSVGSFTRWLAEP